MIFNGFTIWFVSLLALIGTATIIVSHFLKARQKTAVVPTILFWQQAYESSKRNILFGGFSSVLSMLFILLIMLMFLFGMLKPVFYPIKKIAIVIDTSCTTDINLAINYARSLIVQNDKCSVISAGKDITTHSSFDSNISTSLAALNLIKPSKSSYSSLYQAIKEAKSASKDTQVVVLTGQPILNTSNVQVFSCPSEITEIINEPMKLAFPDHFALAAQAYCESDKRFEFCEETSRADYVLPDIEVSAANWKVPQFVELLSKKIESTTGIKYRTTVERTSPAQKTSKPPIAYKMSLHGFLLIAVLILLLTEIYLFRKGVIV